MELVRKNEKEILVVQDYLQKDKNGEDYMLPLMKYPLLEETGIVEHCFTTRLDPEF